MPGPWTFGPALELSQPSGGQGLPGWEPRLAPTRNVRYVRNVRNDADTLLSTTEVAALCGVAAMTVVRWIDSGALPAVRTPGGWRRVRRADAERHAAKVAGRVAPPSLPVADLVERLTAGHREELVAWARAHAGTRASVGELVLSHLAPAMREIGDAWDCGDTSVAEEHRATGLAYEILTLLRDALPGVPRDANAPRVMILCPAGEEHALPARMAAERFVDAGWRVDYLGANVPAAEAVRQAERTRPAALGISVTTAQDGARALLRELGASEWRGPILIGGALASDVAQGMPDVLVDDGTEDLVTRVATQVRDPEVTPR